MELMLITPRIREMIFEARASEDLRAVAIQEGMRTLYFDGMLKACDGLTTFDEVYRVAKRTEQDQLQYTPELMAKWTR